jgi:Extensin-like protein C-terminus
MSAFDIEPFGTDFESEDTLELFDEFAEEARDLFPEYGEEERWSFDPESADLLLASGHCPHCGLPREEFDFEFEAGGNPKLTDIVINPPSSPGNYGRASSFKNPTTTTERCKGGVAKTCPALPGLEDVSQVSGIGFEYIAGWTDKHKKRYPGIIFSKSTGKWIVVEKNRLKKRVRNMLPRAGDALATFIANMKAINMPVEAILTMGSVYCRCISDTTKLSNHSYGDAIDIGGVRFVGGREVLVANSGDAADRKLLHRTNACLRLSFATVIDYHDRKHHWNHFHCDTNIQNGGARRLGVAWPFVRESLGLSPKGGWNKRTKEPANSLKQFAGADAAKDKATLDRTLSRLFMREAVRV